MKQDAINTIKFYLLMGLLVLAFGVAERFSVETQRRSKASTSTKIVSR